LKHRNDTAFPPLAWSAEIRDDHFMLLDETRLPEATVFIRIGDYREAAAAITKMKTRAFGQLLTVLYALVLTARRTASVQMLPARMREAADVLRTSRPTFGFRRYTDMVVAWSEESLQSASDAPGEVVVERILGLLDEIGAMRIRRSRDAASLLDDGDVILTHCNTSGELLLAARICREQGKKLAFYATETRPYFQGRLTAWEMSRDGFDVTLIPDNRVASIMSAGLCSKVITGSDRVALNGDIVNKVGTCQLARLAHEFDIPFYAFVQEPGTTATGEDVEIEYRESTEVTRYRDRDVYPPGTKAFYPAFDVTPHTYVEALVTFGKVLTPADLPAGWTASN
jgi:methylthioribose-1-phosphate isomerase